MWKLRIVVYLPVMVVAVSTAIAGFVPFEQGCYWCFV